MVQTAARNGPRRQIVAACAAVLLSVVPGRAQGPGGYRVIVNPANPVTEVERSFLLRAFLKKITHWPDGTVLRPVDQNLDSQVRRTFTEDVLGRTVAAVRNAWEQNIFDGRDVPPPELDSDAEVIDYVLRNRGAIGYVSPQAPLNGARVVRVE